MSELSKCTSRDLKLAGLAKETRKRYLRAVRRLAECAVKRHLGALPGILLILHTWNGQLGFHPHGDRQCPDSRHGRDARRVSP